MASFISRGVSPQYVENDGIPVINQKCIRNGIIDNQFIKYHNYSKKYMCEKQLQYGDVLINSTGVGTAGRIGIFTNSNCWLADSHVTILRVDDKKCFPKFIFFNLRKREDEIESYAEGSTGQIELGREKIKDIDILLPPLPEQKAIAAVLSGLDDKIDLLHRQNKTLESMAEALFRQWFVEEANESWEEKPLEEILEFIVDNRGKTAPITECGIPLIATNCIKNNNIFPVYEKVRYISDDTYKNWFRAHPKSGDIIFVNKGTPGCVNLVPNPVDFCIAQDMIALRANKKNMSNYYLFLYFRRSEIQSQILNTSVGTTIPHLKKTDLLKFSVLTPNFNLLNEFDNIVDPLFVKMNENVQQIRTLEKMRDSLLPKLMSGEVRVTI